MSGHLRGNLLLLVLTVLLCCVVYPLALWGVGKAVFPEQADGSLITDDGTVRGSQLIGQPFTGAGYFQPRPSAAGSGNGYNALQSGGSNYAASNILLRDRVARQLGTSAFFKELDENGKRKPVGGAIEKWFADRTTPGEKIKPGETDAITLWANSYPTLAGAWVKRDATAGDYVSNWPDHEKLVLQWRKGTVPAPAADAKPKPEDLAVFFFASFAKTNPGKWPIVKEQKTPDGKPKLDEDGKPVKAIGLVTADDDLRATFFEMWYQDTKPDLQPVPADMVLASGSGLDPHITVRNAHYQAATVIEERAKSYPEAEVKKLVEHLIEQHILKPMWGLAGGEDYKLVNVLELNLALDAEMKKIKLR